MRQGILATLPAAILRVARWRVALAVALAVALSATEGVGLLLLLPLLSLVGMDVPPAGGALAQVGPTILDWLGL
jgi:hypothetical protein